MSKYNSYHTALKTCFNLGLEEIIPDNIKKQIPYTTSQDWRNENNQKYIGHEFAEQFSKNLDQTKIILNDKVKYERMIFSAFCRIKITFIEMIGKTNFQRILQSNKNSIVTLFERVKPLFNVKTLCQFTDMKTKTYSSWKSIARLKCPSSVLNICFRKVPNQISNKEINVLKKLMSEPKFFHWPTISIWAYAIRNNLATMSDSSWYRYCRILEISSKRVKQYPKPKYKPLRAKLVNEIWHADVSVFKTSDNIKFYIYTVIDNFSRMILAWDVSTKLSASIRLQSIKRAIEIQFTNAENQSVDLIVDGGSENNNQTIHNFIQNSQVNINKKIALRDIVQSNSMVEATFKLMKYKYFFKQPILSENIWSHMEYFVNDFNMLRPHYAHGIKTPHEVHYNKEVVNYDISLIQAIKERVESNRQNTCDLNCHLA